MRENLPSPCTLRGITYRLITEPELVGASPLHNLDRDFVRQANDRGDIAVGAFDGSELVGYVWRAAGSAPHTDDLSVSVDHPYNYAYKSFVLPKYRGHHIAPALVLASDAEMFLRGYTHRAAFIAMHNHSSISMGKYQNTTAIGYAAYIEWFGFRVMFRTRRVKNIGFKFFEQE